MKRLDEFTIEKEPISPIDLMERASGKCAEWIISRISDQYVFHIFCGPGNNGGDGLAIARMLTERGYGMIVSALAPKSEQCQINFDRLKHYKNVALTVITESSEVPYIDPRHIIIDALLGTGFTGITTGLVAEIIRKINLSGAPVISIDMPSGMHSDEPSLKSGNEIIKATDTLTFQYLKLALLAGENAPFTGSIQILDIGLKESGIDATGITNNLITENVIRALYKPKPLFSHKGTFGHSLLIAGGPGKMGAGILAAKGYLKSGAGLLSIVVPISEIQIIQIAVPEAMALVYDQSNPDLPSLNSYKAAGIGPGIGTGECATKLLDQFLEIKDIPVVLDADALNILSNNPDWIKRLPKGSVLTPHPGEFKRFAGSWKDDFEKFELQKKLAMDYRIYIILKGKNTSIACPDGTLWFNHTGNPGMAKGGSGDILAGLILGLCASGYSSREACLIGTWLHGLAGDFASAHLTQEAMNATDIINFLPAAWKTIISDQNKFDCDS